MNFEKLEYKHLLNYRSLHEYLKEHLSEKTYLLLDEIQRVSEWEKTINSLQVEANVDIYITGSNAYLLSSELSTYLSGRYVEIKMLSLSFKEFLEINQNDQANMDQKFQEYVARGAMPILDQDMGDSQITEILGGIYNTIVIKDVIMRNTIRDIGL